MACRAVLLADGYGAARWGILRNSLARRAAPERSCCVRDTVLRIVTYSIIHNHKRGTSPLKEGNMPGAKRIFGRRVESPPEHGSGPVG